MVTFKIEVGKTKRDGTHPIYIRVTKDREYKRIRFFLDASAKDVTAGGEIKDTMLDVSINEAINSYKHKLLDIGAAVDEWSVTQIAEYLTAQPKKKEEGFELDFIAFGREHVAKLKAADRMKTAEGYNSALNNFCKFLKRDSIDINQINKAMLLEYKDWFEREGFGNRAWEMYMSNLKTLHNNAKLLYNDEDDEKLNIKLSPFKTIQFRRSAVEKRDVEPMALSATALRYIWKVPMERLTPRGKMARDAFFLSFSLCGMNAVDMWKHKQAEDCKADCIEYYRSKTARRSGKGAFTRVHINKYMKEVHERNRGKRHTWFYAELYSTSNNFNAALSYGLADLVNNAVTYYGLQWNLDPGTKRKQILKRLELPTDRNLIFYAARDSFSTIAGNDCHVPTEIIDRCLCHVVKSVAAEHYIKKDYRFTDETVAKVVGFVFGEQQQEPSK